MPTEVIARPGAVDSLGEQCMRFGSKPFVVTGRASARLSGALSKVKEQVPEAEVYEGIGENPTIDECDAAAEACRQAGCDVVVGIGGGSPMDAAKAVAGAAAHGGACREYMGKGKLKGKALPIIAVPTTAGTGSETTPSAVLVDPAAEDGNPVKRTMGDPGLFPRVALLDPELTLSLPRSVTANTGLDVLSQAMEGMLSLKSTPMGDVWALETCRIVRRWLPVAVADGADLEARAHMQYAAMLSGCIIAQSGTTLVHGMGYYYTLHCGVAHGLANALLLAPVFEFNALHEPEKVAEIARALGVEAGPSAAEAAEGIAQAVHGLLLECGANPAASQHGVEEFWLKDFTESICQDAYRFRNQVGTPGPEQVRAFFQQSFEGTLRPR
jgi:alcohol dehydrogenase class IV